MESAGRRPIILVVEDQPTNMLLARTTLQRAGHRVIEAVDADEARERLQDERPDLILMDIGLPGQDGLSFTHELMETQEFGDIPVIAVTAHAMQTDHVRALEAGCSDVLHKPYSPRQLVMLVSEYLKPAGQTG